MQSKVGTQRGRKRPDSEAESPDLRFRGGKVACAILAMLPPFVFLLLQHLLWPVIRPFAWFLFYPAVFLSAWIGGARAGVVATMISALMVWWSFVPPEHMLAKEDPRYLLPTAVFVVVGIVFSIFQGRLRNTTRRLNEALTAARVAGEKLQDVNQQNTRLIEQASDGIFIADLNGRYLDVNSAGCVMLGHTREEIVGRTVADFIPPADLERLRKSKERLLQGAIQVAEWAVRRRDGSYLPVEVSAKILPDGRWQAFVRDISERKRSESATRMLARLQAAVADLGVRALRAHSPAHVLDEAVALVARTLDLECSNVLELLPDGETLLLRSGVGWKEGLVGHTTIRTGSDSESGYALFSGRPVVVGGPDAETRFSVSPLLQEHGVVSGMSVVVATSTGPYGILGAYTRHPRNFSTEEIHFLEAAANVLGHMIGRCRTEAALRESEANLNRAQEVAHLGSWCLDIVHNRLTWSDEVFRIFGVPLGTPLTYETFLATVHRDDREYVEKAWANALHGMPYDVEHRIHVDDELRWVRERARVEIDAAGNPVQGIGTVQDITQRKLAQARLLRINQANRALSKCNEVLIRAVDESALLQQICEIVVQEAGYRLCWVGRAEQDEAKSVQVIARAGWEAGYLATLKITWADDERGRGPTGTCIRTRSMIIARDIASDARMAPWRAEALKRGYASSIAIPLVIASEIFGALTIYAVERDAFGNEEVELLTELASDLAFGIGTLRTRAERARAEEEIRTLNAELEQRVLARTAELQAANRLKDELIVREQAVTTELQQAREREFAIGCRIQQTLLLDQPPADFPGLCIAALTIPTQRIDGDFYTFIRHGKECLDVIVGDVMGKGVPAALLGAATKAHFLKALTHLMALSTPGRLPQPKEIVMLTHAEIVRQLIELESFVTLCYARFDATGRRLELVDCGHTGIVQWHGRTGRSEVFHGDNLPLGVRAEEVYEQVSVPCVAGDLVFFFSDGITEARNSAGEPFGTERLQQYVQAYGQLEPPALVQAIRNAVVAHCGCDRLNDDLTCVAIRVEEVELPIARAEISIRSELLQLRRARQFVRSFCEHLPATLLEEESVSALVLAANEAASNIMKHAYHGRGGQWIDLEAEAFSSRVSIRLLHVGDPFDAAAAPVPALDGSRESGFGVYMLTRSVDEVRYYRDERGRNCVALGKFSSSYARKEGETVCK